MTLVVDVVGKRCPIPVSTTRQNLDLLDVGDTLEVITTDPLSAIDLPNFCNREGHTLLMQIQNGDRFHFYIRKNS